MIEEWRSAGVDALQIIFHDYNGIARARSVRLDQLPAVFDRGVNFSSPTLDFNSQDLFPRDAAFDLASPDVWAKPDPDTFWSAPVSPTTGHMYADLVDARGRPWEGCVRSALRRAVDRAAARGVSFQVGFEPEGYVFSGRDEGIAAIGTPQFATLDGLDRHEEYAAELIANLAAAGIDVEQWTKEYGAGQIEVNLRYGPALVSADRLATFKHLFRAIARRHGLLGTFMPKPLATAAGSGLHVHLSATPTGGEARNLFDDPGDTELALSTIGRQALAGLLVHGQALTALGASTVNSYKRFLPGSWAPTHVMFAPASRAAFVRLPERETARRLELRVGDPACNPYLYLTGILVAMLDGIERELDPGRPVPGNVGALSHGDAEAVGARALPRTLGEALDRLAEDDILRDGISPLIVDEYIKIKRSEWEAFYLHVGEWDHAWYLDRY